MLSSRRSAAFAQKTKPRFSGTNVKRVPPVWTLFENSPALIETLVYRASMKNRALVVAGGPSGNAMPPPAFHPNRVELWENAFPVVM